MKRPMMDDDLNGDGIPDGASVTVKWTKGAGTEDRGQRSEVRNQRTTSRPMMDENAARPLGTPQDEAAYNAGLVDVGRGGQVQSRDTVDNTIRLLERPRPAFGATNAVQNAAAMTATNEYEGRNREAAGMMGIRQTSRPMMTVDAQGNGVQGSGNNVQNSGTSTNATRQFLQTRMGDASVRPELRSQAGQRLAVMDETATRESAQGSQERMADSQARGMIGKAEADRDARVAAADSAAQARVQAAETGAQGRVQAAEAGAAGRQAELDKKIASQEKIAAARLEMDRERTRLMQEYRGLKTNADKQKAIDGMMDEVLPNSDGFSSGTLRQYIARTRGPDGNVLDEKALDPAWESYYDDYQKRVKDAGPKQAEPAKLPSAGGAAPIQGKVRMRGPDGKVRLIDPAQVEAATKAGGTLL